MDTCCAVLSFCLFKEKIFYAKKSVHASKNVDELKVQSKNPIATTEVKQRKSLNRSFADMLVSPNKSSKRIGFDPKGFRRSALVVTTVIQSRLHSLIAPCFDVL